MAKKLFISQPMNGLSDDEILKEREKLIKKAEKVLREEVELVDSFFEEAPEGATALYYLGKSIELLSTADVAFFAKGWNKMRGCKIEHECADKYGVQILEEKE